MGAELESEEQDELGIADAVVEAIQNAVERKGTVDLYDRTSIVLSMLIHRSRGDFECTVPTVTPPGNLELNATRWRERFLTLSKRSRVPMPVATTAKPSWKWRTRLEMSLTYWKRSFSRM